MKSPSKVVAFVIILAVLSACNNYTTKSKLMSIQGVSKLTDYLVYEGTIEATLLLDNGGSIWIHNIVDEQFVSTDRIDVVRIGRILISCQYDGQIGSTSSGHNIIEIVAQLTEGAESALIISNISQLVDRYDDVIAILGSLPNRAEPGMKIRFANGQPIVRSCYKVLQE